MELSINSANTVTLDSTSMNDTVNMTVYNITYSMVDLRPLPTTFTATIFDTATAITFLDKSINDYVKQVGKNTILTLRIPKNQ